MSSLAIVDFSLDRFRPNSRNRLWLEVQAGLLEPLRIPALVARGTNDGPTLLVIAGVHGDEYEGMEAIRLVFDGLDPSAMHGSFIGVPIANPYAYDARSRNLPGFVDGLNLARVFPGDPHASPGRSLAHALLAFVQANVTSSDLLVDFHSGSADVQFAALTGFRDIPNPSAPTSEEAARHFGSGALWRIPDSPGPLNAEASRLGIPTIGTETTGRAGCRPEDVDNYVNGLGNLLRWLGIIDGSAPPRNPELARRTRNVNAPITGFFRHRRLLHERVTAGETLGWLIDPFGEPIETVSAPVSGELWAVRAMPPVRTGELLFMIATDPDSA